MTAGSFHQPFGKLDADAGEPVTPPSTVASDRVHAGEGAPLAIAAPGSGHSPAVDHGETQMILRAPPTGVAHATGAMIEAMSGPNADAPTGTMPDIVVDPTAAGSGQAGARDIRRGSDEPATDLALDTRSAARAVADSAPAGMDEAVRTTLVAAAASPSSPSSSSATPVTPAVPAMSAPLRSIPPAPPWPPPAAAQAPLAPRWNHPSGSAPSAAAHADIAISRRVASFLPVSTAHRTVFTECVPQGNLWPSIEPFSATNAASRAAPLTSRPLVMARAAAGPLASQMAMARTGEAAPHVEWSRPLASTSSPLPVPDATPGGTPAAPASNEGTALSTVHAASPSAGVVMRSQSMPVAASAPLPRGITAAPTPTVAATTVQLARALPLPRPMSHPAREPSVALAPTRATAGEMHGVVPVAREALPAPAPASPADTAQAQPAAAAPDIGQLVEHALRELMFRLDIERERRGYSRWS
jgi:hypothetical protein